MCTVFKLERGHGKNVRQQTATEVLLGEKKKKLLIIHWLPEANIPGGRYIIKYMENYCFCKRHKHNIHSQSSKPNTQ